jgi:hypothetical protein
MSDAKSRTVAAACVVAAIAATCASALPASAASELGVNQAKAATAEVAKQLCDQDPRCVKSTARYCDRQSDFKLICIAFTITRTGSGDRVQCRTQVVVSGKPGGTLKTSPRRTRCA